MTHVMSGMVIPVSAILVAAGWLSGLINWTEAELTYDYFPHIRRRYIKDGTLAFTGDSRMKGVKLEFFRHSKSWVLEQHIVQTTDLADTWHENEDRS